MFVSLSLHPCMCLHVNVYEHVIFTCVLMIMFIYLQVLILMLQDHLELVPLILLYLGSGIELKSPLESEKQVRRLDSIAH